MSNNSWLNIPPLNKLDINIINKIRDEYFADDIIIPNDILGWTENDFRIYFESGGKIEPICWLNKIKEISIKI